MGEMTTMALVPQVADAVRIPVIAAGGIADGRQLLAASPGAVGVQLGTCLLVSEECPIHDNYKQAVLKAKDSDTIVTGRIGGVRCASSKMPWPGNMCSGKRRGRTKWSWSSIRWVPCAAPSSTGTCTRGSLMAGQVAGMCREIKPLRRIFEELYSGYRTALEALKED